MSFFVRKSNYTAMDCHDMASVVTQMQQDDSYEIQDPETMIATDIYNNIKDVVANDVTVDTVKQMLCDKSGTILCTVPSMVNNKDNSVTVNPSSINIFAKGPSKLGYEMCYKDMDYTDITHYMIDEIELNKAAYLVTDHKVNPGKGYDLVERCYHVPFESLQDAQTYQREQMKDYEAGTGMPSVSGYKIFVVDNDKMLENPWYKENMLAVKYMDKLGKNYKDYQNYTSAHAVVGELCDEVYQTASEFDKFKMDNDVFHRMEKYLPEEDVRKLKDSFAEIQYKDFCSSMSRRLANQSIMSAFVNATSQETYDAIHKDLGEYEHRISKLIEIEPPNYTYNYCAISKTGEVKFYEHGFSFNFSTLDEVEENPYLGSIHRYCGNRLSVFDVYSPNNFVDTLPSVEAVEKWHNKYKTAQQQRRIENRMAHNEMSIYKTNSGKSYFKGYWYINGIEPECTLVQSVNISKTYGNHEFTEEECKLLLNGDTVTIKDFKTKSGDIVDIAGKLGEYIDTSTGKKVVDFVRVDLDKQSERVSQAESLVDNMEMSDVDDGMPFQ